MPNDEDANNKETKGRTNPSIEEGTEIDTMLDTQFVSTAKPVNSAPKPSLGNQQSHEATSQRWELLSALPQHRYRIQEKLGSGAMGVVNLADDLLIQRQVAVKTLKREQSETRRQGFLRETRIQGRLQHPNIVTLYDAGFDESGTLAIVMQYINGQTLSDLIDRMRFGDQRIRDRFSLEARLDVFASIINALSYAHNKNLIHCDVKPANVIIGDHGEVWLADWGIARTKPTVPEAKVSDPNASPKESNVASRHTTPLSEGATVPAAIFGTPRYMAPEQASGNVHEVDEKSDIYSAFILLFELLTLSDWISSKLTLHETLEAARSSSVLSIHDAVFDQKNEDSVPTELRYFLQKGLAHDREERFADCNEVLQGLLKIRNGDFAIQCPITLVKRGQNILSHAIDRHPRIVIFLLLFACIVWLCGVTGGILYALG
ncbi:MAG: serine/threonine protein kinase [Rubripirellula sp.]|nr:serine/threonine protein kinase [Rubripirellula sp.]